MSSSSNRIAGGAPPTYVVGAGMVGLCVAWRLQQEGVQVVVVDRDEPACGCSFGNAGALSFGSVAPLAMPGTVWSAPGMLLDPNGPIHIPLRYWLKAMPWLIDFVRAARPDHVERIAQSLALFLAPAAECHVEILREIGATDLLRFDGQLYLYRNTRQLASDDATWNLKRRYGLRAEVMARDAFLELEPRVGPKYEVAVFTPDQGSSIDPYRHAMAIADDFVRKGGVILKEEVTGFARRDDRITGVVTHSGTLEAERVIICAGAWSRQLLLSLGYDVPLESQRGYHVMVARPDSGIRRPVILSDRRVFVTPMSEGIRAAGTVEFGGLDLPPTARRLNLLARHFAEAFPEIEPLADGARWMGHRPCLPDSMPIIGKSERHNGLWFAFGHGHLGFTGAAVTGRILASEISGQRRNVDISPFSIHRFDPGRRVA